MTRPRRDGRHISPFAEWYRKHPALDSIRVGLSVNDIDHLFHRYLHATDKIGERRIISLMIVEEKTWGAELTFAQKDDYLVLSQLIPLSEKPCLPFTKKVRTARGNWVQAKWYGFHVVTFSSAGPLDSDSILWDGREIGVDVLVQLLRFDVSPITLRPITARRHHRGDETGRLFE